MDIIIREIKEIDYPEIANLFVKELTNNMFTDEGVIPFFKKVKNDENYKTFVALFDNNAVGFISTVIMDWITSKNLFIQAFAVKNEYQNKGIGKKLLNYTEEYVKSKEIKGIGLQSGVQRHSAHIFYEKNGYIKSNYFYKNF